MFFIIYLIIIKICEYLTYCNTYCVSIKIYYLFPLFDNCVITIRQSVQENAVSYTSVPRSLKTEDKAS